MTVTSAAPTWKSVTHREPCRVCSGKGWCSVSEDGRFLLCRRVQQEGAKAHTDRHGSPYWIYRTGEAASPTQAAPKAPETDPALMDRAYRALLASPAAALSKAHREALLARGMSRRTILHSGCRSMPREESARRSILHDMARAVGAKNLPLIPGVVFKEGRPRLRAGQGILIPTTCYATGQLVALHLRADQGATRYYWLSSNPEGPGPRLASFIAFPDGQAGPWESARVVEGEFKAMVAAQFTGLLTVSVPGVDLWSLAVPVLKQMGVRRVLLAYDSDWHTNPRVARALLAANSGFEEAGFQVDLETWPAQFKGIDDFLTQGGTPQ